MNITSLFLNCEQVDSALDQTKGGNDKLGNNIIYLQHL